MTKLSFTIEHPQAGAIAASREIDDGDASRVVAHFQRKYAANLADPGDVGKIMDIWLGNLLGQMVAEVMDAEATLAANAARASVPPFTVK